MRPARKRLLLDLATVAMRAAAGAAQRSSNFEGIAAGPPAPDGAPTIMLVSDDNFRDTPDLRVPWLEQTRDRVHGGS